MIKHLISTIFQADINPGATGELAARLLFCIAWDDAINNFFQMNSALKL
jgi:hypothetical protein